MRKGLLIYLLALFMGANVFAQNCLPNGITFTSQEQIDNFTTDYPSCTVIEGTVLLNENLPGDITNLVGLNQLTMIGGHFEVTALANLQNFIGLENLVSIGGSFHLQGNEGLIDFSGLGSLTSVELGVYITSNPSIISLSGLDNLTNVGEGFTLQFNSALESIEGLSSLNSTKNIQITSNGALTSFTGLEGIYSLERLVVQNNGSLQNLVGLENLSSIDEFCKISGNANLENLTGLESLITIGGYLKIGSNVELLTLAGINNLTSVGGHINIEHNTELISLEGLESMTSLVGGLTILANNKLVDFQGLEAFTALGSLHITNNEVLVDLSALQNLINIDNYLEINNNDALTSLLGLDAVTNVGTLFILGNAALEDLSDLSAISIVDNIRLSNTNLTSLAGLESLTSIAGDLHINNASLVNLNPLNGITSIGGYLRIYNNSDLLNLEGLESVSMISGLLSIKNNDILENIAALENVDFTNTDSIRIVENPQLAICELDNICQYIADGGEVIVYDNAIGCNTIDELLLNCGITPHTNFVGRVIVDVDLNCEESGEDFGIANWLVSVFNDDYTYVVSTDNLGRYWRPVVAGDYALNAVLPPAFWSPCTVDTLLHAEAIGDSIIVDFLISPQGDCPYLDWSATIPPLRICQSRTVTVSYCNYGALPAEDAIFSIGLDAHLTIDSASIAYTVSPEGLLLFEIDPVDVFECGQFTMSVFLDCEGVAISDLICIDVNLLSEELCAPDASWDGSIITATGFCENDSTFFQLENIGTGDMFQSEQFRVEIVIDDIILMMNIDEYQLTVGEILILAYEVEGQGMRLVADQTQGNPLGIGASVVVPNCEDALNNEILTLLPNENGDPFSEVFCVPATNSYDPNIKTAIPEGVGENHEIKKDWNLNYTIEFQNTGNDVAYVVVIKDTLSENLDLTTLRVKGASHPFTWSLNIDSELVFTFDDILLPDSTSNEPGSHGYIQFSITPKGDILPYETIENKAAIYFDFNDPIITNTVLHTILKPVVGSSERLVLCENEVYQGQTITQDTTIHTLTSFIEYDSIHFVHIEILPQIVNTIDAETSIGEYVEGVLIENDTSFVVSFTAGNGCDSLVTYAVSVITDVAGIDPFKAVEIYPNPVSTTLHVLNHQNGEAQEWTLVNNLGVNVWKTNLPANELLEGVRVRNLPAGIYCLQVKTNQRRKVWKVVVQ